MLIVYQSLNSGNQDIHGDKGASSAINGRFAQNAHEFRKRQTFYMQTSRHTSMQPSVSGCYPYAMACTEGASGTQEELSDLRTPKDAGIKSNIEMVDLIIEQIIYETSKYGQPDIIVLGEPEFGV